MARRGENLYKRKDGRWEGRYIKGRKENGKPHYGYVYGYKFNEVRSELRRLKCYYADRQNMPIRFRGTLSEWAHCFMEETVRSNKAKPSTYAFYHGMLQNHILPALGKRKLADITQADVNAFVGLLQSKNLGANSVRGVMGMLNRLMMSAVKKNALLANPCNEVELPAKAIPRIEPLTLGEQGKLEAAAMADPDGLFVMMGLYTGVRIGECAQRWDNIDFDAGTLDISHTLQRIANTAAGENKTVLCFGTPKSVYSNRAIPLTAKMRERLATEKKTAASEYIVSCRGRCAEPRTLRYRFERIVKAAGIRHINFHVLRHTFATRCIETGMDVAALSRILGHSSIKMTLDTYAGATLDHKAMSIRRLDDLYADKLPKAV